MSDPTYRIDVEHRPHDVKEAPWNAIAHRLSDEMPARSFWAETAEDAVRRAQEWIAHENAPQVAEPGFSLYVDDDGRPVEGHATAAYCHNCHGYGVKDGEPCPACSGVEGHSVKA